MAILSPGSVCAVCSENLGEEKIVACPPFVQNRADAVYLLHDAVVHERCLRALSVDDAVRHELRRAASADRVGRCVGCGDSVGPEDGHFAAGLLTSDPSSPCFKYNFMVLHHGHGSSWGDCRSSVTS